MKNDIQKMLSSMNKRNENRQRELSQSNSSIGNLDSSITKIKLPMNVDIAKINP